MEMTLDAQIRDAAVINHHPANAITHAVFLKTNRCSSGSIGIPKGSSFHIALSSLGFGAIGFVLVTTDDRNRLFRVYLQQ